MYVWIVYYYYMLPCKSHLIHLQLGAALWANKFTTNCVHSSNKLLLTNVATHTHTHMSKYYTEWHTRCHTEYRLQLIIRCCCYYCSCALHCSPLRRARLSGCAPHFCYEDFNCQQVGRLNLNLRRHEERLVLLLGPAAAATGPARLLFRTNTIKYWVPLLMCLLLLLSLGRGMSRT